MTCIYSSSLGRLELLLILRADRRPYSSIIIAEKIPDGL